MLDSLKPYSDLGNEAGTFLGCEIDSTFLPSVPIGNTPGECRKALTAAEKYQHHLKGNACWPASHGRGKLRLAQLLTRFKSSMGVSTIPGEKSCKRMITGQIEVKSFCDRLAERTTKSD